MVREFALDPALYVKAGTDIDLRLMHQMREQDQVPEPTDYNKPRFSVIVGPTPFTMPRGWEFFLTNPYEGPTYISTVAFNAGYPVRIIDVRYAIDPLNEAIKQINEGTDILGICCFEDNFPFVQSLIERVKEKDKNMPIICGGSLISSLPQLYMSQTQTDIAVISEGELTILELLDSFHRGAIEKELPNIHGIWYRDEKGNVITNQPRGQMKDLDFLPRMRLDLWPQYHEKNGLQPQIITSYSRGCKMDCSFCYRTTPQIASKSPEKFAKDMKWLKDQYKIDFVMFSDLTFTTDKKQTIEMCDVISDYDIKWSCLTRCHDVDKERLESMQRSGCDLILYGVESLNPDALKTAHKCNSKDATMKALTLTQEANIRFGALLIVGLPGEKEETLNYTASWAEENNHVVRVKYLSLLPGTPFYHDYLNKGVIKSNLEHAKWLSIEQCLHNDEIINVSGLPENVVRDAYKRMYDAYQPGPVMNFKHFPKHFEYTYPNSDDGKPSSVQYASEGWRSKFSSAGPYLTPGSEKYTFESLGLTSLAETGSALAECGAKQLEKSAETSTAL